MKRYFFCWAWVLLSILMCANFCFPKESEGMLKRDSGDKDYRLASNTSFVKVPFELISNHIYLEVKINNSIYLSFMLDTGARFSYLDLSRANELKIEELNREEAKRTGSCDDLPLFKFDSIGVGDLTIFDQKVLGISLSPLNKFEGTNLDGILGFDFLHRFVVEIDYINQILTIYEPDKFNYTGKGEVVKINLELGIPKVKGVVDGEQEGMFEIDTGNRNGLDFYASFIKDFRLLEKYPKYLETSLGFGITGPVEGAVGRITSFQLGSFLLKSPVTGFHLTEESPFGSYEIAGKIGGGILKRFKVIFDYPHYRMILEKNKNYHLRDRYNTSGMQLIQENNKIIVYQVMKKSPADECGIAKDDEILSINGVLVSNYSLQELREILNQEEGTQIELTLKRMVGQLDRVTVTSEVEGETHRKEAKTEKVKLTLKELI
jgi:hypothetical protein